MLSFSTYFCNTLALSLLSSWQSFGTELTRKELKKSNTEKAPKAAKQKLSYTHNHKLSASSIQLENSTYFRRKAWSLVLLKEIHNFFPLIFTETLMHNLCFLIQTTMQGVPEQQYSCSTKCTEQRQIQFTIRIWKLY